MNNHPTIDKLITSIGFTQASPANVRDGLIGFITCAFADVLLLDGITLRVTSDRRPTLSFPSRTDGQGRKHPYFRPIDNKARMAIEAAVFDALGIDPEVGL